MNERRTLERRLRAKGYRRVYDNADATRWLARLEGSFPDVLRQVAALPGPR